MAPIKSPVIVLRRTNYGEADRILQVITPHHGKLGLIAKGVRREKSKLAGAIELFSHSTVTLVTGRGKLGVLTSARLNSFYGDILKDYDRLQFGYEALKKISNLAEHINEPSLYDKTLTVLISLNDFSIDLRLTKAWFYLQAAELTGHGLNLSRDDKNKPLSADARYQFDISLMNFVMSDAGNFNADHLKLLKVMQLKTPSLIARISGIDRYLDDCLSLAHAVGE